MAHLRVLRADDTSKPEGVQTATYAVQSFRDLCATCVFNIRYFKGNYAAKYGTCQMLVGVEEQRDRRGMTATRVIALIELAEEELASESGVNKKIGDQAIRMRISQKVVFILKVHPCARPKH